MKKILDLIKKYRAAIIAFVVGLIIPAGIVSAAILYDSANVHYNNSSSGLSSTNVQQAIDELKGKCDINQVMSMTAMCPDCVYAFPTTTWYYNTTSAYPKTTLSSSQYKTTWQEVVAQTGKNYFVGVRLNGSNQITNAYACAVIDSVKGIKAPFCLETKPSDTYGGTSLARSKAYVKNNAILGWIYESNCTAIDSGYECKLNNLYAKNTDSVTVTTGETTSSGTLVRKCNVEYNGEIVCTT